LGIPLDLRIASGNIIAPVILVGEKAAARYFILPAFVYALI
jgi:hypothetical protein